MSLECPQCKALNPNGNHFCGQCGNNLKAALTELSVSRLREEIAKVIGENYKD